MLLIMVTQPKGLLPFHKYKSSSCVEQLSKSICSSEAVLYASSHNKNAKLHFTISEKHQEIVLKA